MGFRSWAVVALVVASAWAGAPAVAEPAPGWPGCDGHPRVPTYTRATGTFSGTRGPSSATVTWRAPMCPGSGISSYELTVSDGRKILLPPTALSATVGQLSGVYCVIRVRALNEFGEGGEYAYWHVGRTLTIRKSDRFAVAREEAFHITTVAVSSRTALPGMPVVLQRLTSASPHWVNVATGYISGAGSKIWTVRQSTPSYYRVVSRGRQSYLGSISAPVAVRLR